MARSDDTAILSITLSHRRESVSVGTYAVPVREGAIITAAIDQFVRKIMEGECPTSDE